MDIQLPDVDIIKTNTARNWIVATKDLGPETPEVCILETEDQLKTSNNKIYRQNTEVYKQWAREVK